MEKNDFKGDTEAKHIVAQVESSALEEIDPIAERKLVRKLDFILLPLFCLICEFMVLIGNHRLKCIITIDCVNFIDRHVPSECILPSCADFRPIGQLLVRESRISTFVIAI